MASFDAVELRLSSVMAVVFEEATERGFRPYEKTALFAAYLLTGYARPLAEFAHLPLSPVVVAALMVVVARRCLAETASRPQAAATVCEPGAVPA